MLSRPGVLSLLMSVVLLVVAIPLALVARSAVRGPSGRGPLWVTAMAGSELAGWLGLVTLGLGAAFSALGWAGGAFGVAALGLLLAATIAFSVAIVRGFRAASVIRKAVPGTRRPGPMSLVFPVSRVPRGIRSHTGIRYGPDQRHVLDILEPNGEGPHPIFVHVHGGGWWRGRRDTQARPIVHRLVRAGWLVVTPSYRLSPAATPPDHLEDVWRAIGWIRQNAASYGGDPSFIALSGGSTGGNLAALAALTAPEHPAGLGSVEVQACVPLYGVHHVLDAHDEPLWPYLVTAVFKVPPSVDRARWVRSSPISVATADRPPFLVIHGANDTLVSPSLSRRLVDGLRRVGGPEVVHVEVPWANHGFDFFAGPRGRAIASAIEAHLERLYAVHRAAVD